MAIPWKVTIFGAGGTGGSLAQLLAMRQYAEVILIDIDADLAAGKALDIGQSGAINGSDSRLFGTADVTAASNSDIVVITAGSGRKPGLSREDLLATNAAVVTEICQAIRLLAPNAFVIVLTNPADILSRIALSVTGFPHQRVMGQGGILDSARLAYHIAQQVDVAMTDVRTMVLGGHGDHMVPVRRFAAICGIPASDLLTEAQWQTAVRQTRFGGGEILAKFKTHGAAVTPAYAVLTMIEALQSDKAHLLPISTCSMGVYGLPSETFIGLPVKLSRQGIDEVLELPIANTELAALHQSAAAMDSAFATWRQNHSV